MTFKGIETHTEVDLSGLQAALGRTFARPELLILALTHRSLANEQALSGEGAGAAAQQNERLEFLGDAVIGLVVAELLFEQHPDWTEGELTVVRGRLVSRQHVAEVAETISLGSYLRLSKGEERAGLRHKTTVLSNTMEAVLGALYLDGGFEPVRAFALRFVVGDFAQTLAEELRSGAALGNYKSALQEHLQAQHLGAPSYRVKGESGPDHRKRFLVEVRLRASEGETVRPLARGVGSTKKLAEQDAARRALLKLMAEAENDGQPDAGSASDKEALRSQ